MLALPLAALLALAMVGCGSDDDSGDGGGGDGGGATGALADVDFGGQAITVGSKDFDEQLLLGQMVVIALQEAGADVTDETDTGGTNVARDALLNGNIDVYPEYNGTGWTEHLGNEDPSSDPTELYEVVRDADLEENDIHWLGSSGFNNTYGFATSRDFVDETNDGEAYSFATMAAYLEENADATVCMESEFPDRSDGLVLWEEETGYEIPESQITILDTNVIYTETNGGTCDFGEIFTTDGRIGGLDLVLVEDPGAMIIYNVSLTVRGDAYDENPEGWDTVAEAILEGLDQDKMNELNARVSFDGEDPADVARDYLVEQGLIEG